MLILFDHGTPKGLVRALSGHTVHTAQSKGWDTLSNGALLNAAEEAGFELLPTTDRHIRYQQNLRVRRIAPRRPDRYHQVVARSATCRAHRCRCGFRDAWQLRRGRDSLRAEVTELVRFTCAVYHGAGRKSLKARGGMLVSLTFASWNRVVPWLRAVDDLRRAALSGLTGSCQAQSTPQSALSMLNRRRATSASKS